jgi:hypothetical protein
MRRAQDVVQTDEGLSARAGGTGMTTPEARIVLTRLASASVTPRETFIAIRDMPGLRPAERSMLLAELAARGEATTVAGVIDVRSAPDGRLDVTSGRALLEAVVTGYRDHNSITLESTPTGGGRVNFAIYMENDARRGPPGFSEASASRVLSYMRDHGMSAAQIRSAIAGANVSDAERALVLKQLSAAAA